VVQQPTGETKTELFRHKQVSSSKHTPAETGMESHLRTVLHVSHGLNQLHSCGLKMQFIKTQCIIPAHIHRLWLLDILLTDL